MLIYKITNRKNGKIYIGKWQGRSARDRWKQHIRAAKNGSTLYLSNAIRKYGADAFTVEVIRRAKTPEELSAMETFFIVLHQSHVPANGYNMTLGGDGAAPGKLNWMYGRPKTGRLLEGCRKGGAVGGKMHLGQKWAENAEGRKKLSQYRKEHPPAKACDAFREMIILWLRRTPQMDAVTICKRLRANGYSKGIQSVRSFVNSLRKESTKERQNREWNEYLAHPNFCAACGSFIIPRRKDFSSVKTRKYCKRACANAVNNKRSAAAAA
jgi:group I intron endonuclease